MAKEQQKPRGAVRQQQPSSASPVADNTPAQRGAAKHKVRFSDQGRSWLRHHRMTAQDAWARMLKTPLPSLMTLAVLAIALALPGLMYVGLKNIHHLGSEWQGDPRLSLYLEKSLPEAQTELLSQKLLLRQDLVAVELVSREQGLHEFQKISGFNDVLEFLGHNPLPAVIVVQPAAGDKANMLRLQGEFSQLAGVDQVVLDMVWVERLASFVELANRVVLVLGALLALSVLLVVGNTIRLSIENRKDEIQVAKLVGATDSWVQRPFIYTGFWFGLIGALLAWLCIQSSLLLLSEPVARLAALYQSDFIPQGLGLLDSLTLLICGIALGLGGARMAVGRHLREIEPQ